MTPIDYKITEWFYNTLGGWGIILYGTICLIVTIFCSGLLGFEREYHGHSAGLRTHVLVALGSCLIMYLSMFAFGGFNVAGISRDPARLAAQVITGVGFLGAGTIIQNGSNIKGLTTATTIWSSMAIGLCAGSGNIIICVIATLIMMLVLVNLRHIERLAAKHHPLLVIVVSPDRPVIKDIYSLAGRYSLNIRDSQTELVNIENKEFIQVTIRIGSTNKLKISNFVESIKSELQPFQVTMSSNF